jgi:hypothetical protein
VEAMLDVLMARTDTTPTRQPNGQCPECGKNQVIVEEGRVCVNCGLVDESAAISTRGEDQPFDRRCGPHTKMHHYERLVHFMDYLRSLCATSPVNLDPSTISDLRAITSGKDVSPESVLAAMKQLSVPKRHRKRLYSLCSLLGDGHFVPVDICPDDKAKLIVLFNRAEKTWRHNKTRMAPGRKVFLNYGFLFERFCGMIGKPEYSIHVKPTKHARLKRRQQKQWQRIVQEMKEQDADADRWEKRCGVWR